MSRNVRQCRTKRVPVNLVYGDPGYAPRRFKVTRTCRPKVVYDVQRKQRTRYEVKYKTKPAGGFSACKGPLEAKSAKAAGVDTWRCDDNCFIRKDAQNSKRNTLLMFGSNSQAPTTNCYRRLNRSKRTKPGGNVRFRE